MFLNNGSDVHEIEAPPDSDIVLAKSTVDGFSLSQFYRIDKYMEAIHEVYGFWSTESGLVDQRSSRIVSRRRVDLQGKVITSSFVVLNNDSIHHMTDFAFKTIDYLTKSNYLVVHAMLDRLNVTKKEIFHNTWGYFNKTTRKWPPNSMIWDMLYGGVEIGGSPFLLTHERMAVLDFMPVNTPARAKFVFRSPQLSSGRTVIFKNT